MATLPKDGDWQVQEPVLWTAEEESCRLPPLPLEDVYLHVKAIDNSRLDRARSGSVSAAYGRALGLALLVLGMFIVILMPSALQRLGDRRMLVLQAQRQSLLAEQVRLDAEESALLSPERANEWSRTLELADPAPGQVVALTPPSNPSLKANARPDKQSGGRPAGTTQ